MSDQAAASSSAGELLMPDTSCEAVAPQEENSQYLVAIGASAGGLEALERLFADLPADTGSAFVVIQHLSSEHKSMMDSLLSRHTRMPVIIVEDGMRIAGNHVYLIPPGSVMHLDGHCLRLTPRSPRILTLPIDVFFQSMSLFFGDHAVGVVLSGTGSDGSRGAGAINGAGGFLIAQEPTSAKFDGMPRSVISTGLVDAILPIEDIAARIVAHVTNQPQSMPDQDEPVRPSVLEGPQHAMAGIVDLLRHIGGIDFDDYKPGTVNRRIQRRMTVRQIPSLDSYLVLLQQDRAELQTLRRELLIPVTSFFRDDEAYEALARQVVDPILSARETGQPIRIWCAGVATGEEAYSIAMTFLEAFDQSRRWPTLKIFATDVEQVNIEAAASGTYPESIAAEVAPEQLERFFTKRGNQFVVKNELRQCIVFARHNLLVDPPFTKMDLVVCRNTLIYFRPQAQERVLRRLQYAIGPKGYLFLGSSESLGELQTDFQTINARHKIWQVQRRGSLPLDSTRAPGYGYAGLTPTRPVAASVTRAPGRVGNTAVDQGYSALLSAFAPPPAILVNAAHELVHSYGDVRRILSVREGQASLDINRMLPEALVPVASALLFKSAREGARVVSDLVRLAPDKADTGSVEANARRSVRLGAWPVGEVDGQRLTLLTFEEISSVDRGESMPTVDVESETSERLEVVEHELAATRESLQATIEELETSNEELQATNEEMMSSNEELQSSNEELQSVNEELNTVNAEYQEKIEILNRLNADLDSLARVVSAGTVFVNEHLQLTRFSPDAAQIFRLRNTDIGRPLGDLTHALDYPDFMKDLKRTLDESTMFEKDVPAPDQRHYLVKMLPYRIPSSSARGVVISFVDMTFVHKASQLQSILDGLAEHIAVLDGQGLIRMVNDAWARFAAENGDPGMVHSGPGTHYLAVCQAGANLEGGDYSSRAAVGLRAGRDNRLEHFSMEYPCHSESEERWFVLNVNALRGTAGGVVVSHVNVTAWRKEYLLP